MTTALSQTNYVMMENFANTRDYLRQANEFLKKILELEIFGKLYFVYCEPLYKDWSWK